MFDSSVISVNILHFTIVTYISVIWEGDPIGRNTEIGLFSQENSDKLHIFLRIPENRNTLGHRNFVFWRTEYDKVTILQTLILLKQNCNSS